MRPIFMAAASGLLAASAFGDPLTNADRITLIEELNHLKEQASNQATTRLGSAASAFKSAVASNKAAIDLYLKCVEKVDYEMKERDPSDFRDWKRKNKERLDEEGFALALRHQLQWTILTMRAATKPDETQELAEDMMETLEAIYREPEKLKEHANMLTQPVVTTVFARAYGLHGYKIEGWPMAPLSGGNGTPKVALPFEQLILPAMRAEQDFDGLRSAWNRRIDFQEIACGFWVRDADEEGDSLERDRFLLEEKPQLIWNMEEDLFRAGDQRRAAVTMLKHLRDHIGHSEARAWEQRFRALVDPQENENETAG